MKYLLLIYSNPTSWEHPIFERDPEFLAMSSGERAELTSQAEGVYRDIAESGELVGGAALADPVNTRTVRVRDGVPAITDGLYVEAKEQLAGYFVLDCGLSAFPIVTHTNHRGEGWSAVWFIGPNLDSDQGPWCRGRQQGRLDARLSGSTTCRR